jgi:hypothetical protein
MVSAGSLSQKICWHDYSQVPILFGMKRFSLCTHRPEDSNMITKYGTRAINTLSLLATVVRGCDTVGRMLTTNVGKTRRA